MSEEPSGKAHNPLEILLKRLLPADARFLGEQKITAGAGAQTSRLQIVFQEGRRDWILRRAFDTADAGFGGVISKTLEAATLRAVYGAGIAVPQVIYVLNENDGLGEGFIMTALAGETLPQKILRDAQFAAALPEMASQCGGILAAIHNIDSGSLPALPQRSTADYLALYYRAYTAYNQPMPVFELCFRQLQETMPPAVAPALVHGDFRNGNFIVGAEGIRAVLDWELAHIGDPMEDLGWLCVNAWRFGRIDKPVGGFGERESLYSAYETAGGTAVEVSRVAWWELFGCLKWGVICMYQLQLHLNGSDPSLERVAIGRRISECELDMLELLEQGLLQ